MKKMIGILVVVIATGISCSKPAEPKMPPTETTTNSMEMEIDTLLNEYDALVMQQNDDSQAEHSDMASMDETKLAEISAQLSDKAAQFSPEQLKKYNDITAKMKNK